MEYDDCLLAVWIFHIKMILNICILHVILEHASTISTETICTWIFFLSAVLYSSVGFWINWQGTRVRHVTCINNAIKRATCWFSTENDDCWWHKLYTINVRMRPMRELLPNAKWNRNVLWVHRTNGAFRAFSIRFRWMCLFFCGQRGMKKKEKKYTCSTTTIVFNPTIKENNGVDWMQMQAGRALTKIAHNKNVWINKKVS